MKWFHGKEIAEILTYKNPERAIRKYVDEDDKKLIDFKIKQNPSVTKTVTQTESLKMQNPSVPKTVTQAESLETTRKCFFINESGFYSLIPSSKKPEAREFKRWVTSKVLPSIRKKGFYDVNGNKISIEVEYDLHCKVVDFIRNKYGEALMIAGLGENQRTESIRITAWKKGYMAGQCDLMIMIESN